MRRFRLAMVVTPLVAAAALVPAAAAHADPPDNDDYADRTVVAGLPFGETVDTSEATADEAADAEAAVACNSPEPFATVWYEITVSSQIYLGLSTAGSDYTAGFNVLVGGPGSFVCVAGGAFEFFFVADPGTYRIQVIDDQNDGGGNGGMLQVGFDSLGVPLPEECPGLRPNDPQIPPDSNVIIGTDASEHIQGTPGNDLIIAKGGNDTVDGGDGDDIIFGCDGDDDIDGGAGDDFIIGDSADFFGDPTSMSGGDDVIEGGSGNDQIRGGPGDDDIAGGSGDDELFANQGDDNVSGGAGDDVAVGGFGDDHVVGGPGDDYAAGGPGSDNIVGGPGDDFITGDFPNQTMDEGPHRDSCNGGPGDDFVIFCEVERGKKN